MSCSQAALLAMLIAPVPLVMAENGLVSPATAQSTPAQGATSQRGQSSEDGAVRLVPRWTTPRRAPLLGKASPAGMSGEMSAEMAHAEGAERAYGETGSVEKPVEQPSMIDVVGAGLFISPITDENHQPAADGVQPLAEELPESIRQALKSDALQPERWTTAARIVVHSPDKDDRLPSKLNQLLLSAGASSVENYEVDMTVTRDHIRFYHPSDHMHAIEVAAALDGVLDTLLVKDFSFMRPQPPKGLVEIWLR